MQTSNAFRIAVFPGDGIGGEVIAPTLQVLEHLAVRSGNFALHFEHLAAGAKLYQETGTALPAASLRAARQADAILLGAMGDPAIRYQDGTEIAPQLDLRFAFGLFAGVRPCRAIPGIPLPLADPRARTIDFVLIRESTEGLFASRGKGVVENDAVARDTMVITRATSERLFDHAFALARTRHAQGHAGIVTCVDKANVFASFAFFRRIFDERAARHPDITARHGYIDSTALDFVRKPWDFDVVVTENMFGDILSDLGAALVGGMGMAPSADIGAEHAVFQPCHGSAPDIAGRGIANPTATFLSAAMMLEWLGARHGLVACDAAAARLRRAVDRLFADGRLLPYEFGGTADTAAITRAMLAAIDQDAD